MSRASTVAFVPRNPLARILSGLDRKRFADHVAGAEQAVAALAPELARSLRDDVTALVRRCRQEEADLFGQCREIGRTALNVVEAARLAGHVALAEAAVGIWEMTDALSERGVWHTDALRLHADALARLIASAEDEPDGAAITRELSRMRAGLRARPEP